MKRTALKLLLAAAVLTPVAVYAQTPLPQFRPGNPQTATLLTREEIEAINKTEQTQQTRDENAIVVDIGDKWSMEVGVVHRKSTRNPPPPAAGGGGAAAAATRAPCGRQMASPPADAMKGALSHDNQTEGYYIISGGGTGFIDGELINGRHSTENPDLGPNGPSCGGGVSIGSRKVELKVGDVLIVPPGVVHGWADIPDHVDYLSFRPSHDVMKNGTVNPTIAGMHK